MRKPRDISRIVPSVESLRALAHPDRLRIIGVLRVEGPTTATALAKRFGLNSGATSYHLRQLHAHGFIEPAEELGNRRERWWRSRHESTLFDNSELTGTDLEGGLAFAQAVVSRHAAQIQQAQEHYRDLPVEWRKASMQSDFLLPLTPDQAAELNDKIGALLWEAKATTAPPGEAPPGTRTYMFILYGFPHPDFPADATSEK
jgi:DNA-binding transcriptional ArsR family regulator